jgi:outer membrane protein W
MKYIKIYSFLFFLVFSLAQAQEETITDKNKPFSVGLHYTGNFRNDNIISDSYNGIAGLDARYTIISGEFLNFQTGFSIDYLKGRDFKQKSSIEYNSAWFFNPNVGVEFNIKNSGFKPFFNLGYNLINYSYTIYGSDFTLFDPSDPAFTGMKQNKSNENKSSISLQPGARFYFKNKIYLETSYRFLPIENNVNIHLFNLGLGVNF